MKINFDTIKTFMIMFGIILASEIVEGILLIYGRALFKNSVVGFIFIVFIFAGISTAIIKSSWKK